MPTRFIRQFANLSAEDAAIAGGKGASLGEMTQAGFPVPPGFVILGEAFDQFMTAAGLQDNAKPELREKILQAQIPSEMAEEIIQQFKTLGAKCVAVRSSATGEDSANAAWAGQLETYLNTTEDTLLENIKKCWASLYSERALFYRQEKAAHIQKIAVAVVVQKMVESEKSGIAFSVHPVTQNNKQLIIEAIYGLGEAIVSGATNPDSYTFDKKQHQIIDQQLQHEKAILSDKEIAELSDLIVRLEKHYGYPVDVEWAQENNHFYIIQSRPITTLGKAAPPQKKNIAYVQELCRRYETEIERFNYPCLVLYACLTWYWEDEHVKKYFGATIPFFLFFIKAGAGTLEAPWYLGPGEKVMQQLEKNKGVWIKNNRRQLKQSEKLFYGWLKKHLVKSGKSLDYYLALLHKTVKTMLKHHIHFQISTQIDRLLNKKIPADLLPLCVSDYPAPGVLHDQALTALRAWCRKAKIELKADDFEKNLQKKTFKNKLQACFNLGYFLNAGYGGVKLWTLQDEYTLLAAPDNKVLKRSKTKAPKIRKLTEDQKFWMEAAKHFSEVRDRRKSLQQHTFYRMAQILEEIGKIVGIARSELECLRIEEFKKEFLTNQAVKTFIAERKNGYLGFWAPAVGTWEWNGRTAEDGYAQIAKKYQTVKEIKGNCACPGKAQGKVRVVLNPRLQEKFEEGEILVAGMTSPDYVPFMKKAAAIVTELGGITCHAAIISRELNIPCVIGTNIATKVLKDGDLVEVDANNGVVRILK